MRLLHLHSAVKIQTFSPIFPLAGFTNKAFFRLSLWIFKEKASVIFYNTACFTLNYLKLLKIIFCDLKRIVR